MEDTKKIELFEKMPVARAIMKLAIPTVLCLLLLKLIFRHPVQNLIQIFAKQCKLRVSAPVIFQNFFQIPLTGKLF